MTEWLLLFFAVMGLLGLCGWIDERRKRRELTRVEALRRMIAATQDADRARFKVVVFEAPKRRSEADRFIAKYERQRNRQVLH